MRKSTRQLIGLAIGMILAVFIIYHVYLIGDSMILDYHTVTILVCQSKTNIFLAALVYAISAPLIIMDAVTGLLPRSVIFIPIFKIYYYTLWVLIYGSIGFAIGTFWKFKKKTTLIILGILIIVIIILTIRNSYAFIQDICPEFILDEIII